MRIKTWVGPKRALRNAAGAFSLALVALALACCRESAETQAQVLPPDAKPLCTFEPGEFAGWFETGAVTRDGVVKPKDSLNFAPEALPGERICHFHKWAEQMFLWLTSPAGNERVFQSQDFFAVSAPSGPDHKRDLLRNTSHKNDASLRDSKPLEPGQPDDRYVLMATNESFVYYTTYVNEVYAYFLTGTLNGGITPQPQEFPITPEELRKIIAFGAAHGRMKITTIEDPRAKALTVTVKSAWVELTKQLDGRKYITMDAEIPEYTHDQLNQTWTLSGKTRPATLALVGMHVVGSARSQSPLIWATFEHIDNVPMASYSYMSTTSPDPQTVHPAPNGRWLFSASNCTGKHNEPHMQAPRDAPTINALEGKKIEPSDTCRVNAWGMVPEASNKIERNTQVIAINSSVIGMLATDDVRKNYLLIGTTWGGGAGNNLLANATLETYEQDQNCSYCHKGRLLDGKFNHLFMRTRPLPRQ